MKALRARLGWLAVLLLVSAAVAYPPPANWLIGKASALTGLSIPQIQQPFVLGLDLQGGTSLEYEADVSNVPAADRAEALNGVRDVIERRVNTLGVSEPVIQTTRAGESWRVNVELAGIRDINEAIRLIGETPILEFKEQNDEPARPLTPEESAEKDRRNEEARSNAEQTLKEALGGADFNTLASERNADSRLKSAAGDVGFVKSNAEYGPFLETLAETGAGTVFSKVIDEPKAYYVIKVEEEKTIGDEIHVRHLLVGYQGASMSTSTRSKEEARALIDSLKSQATPENFERLIRENTEEPLDPEAPGDLGWFGKGAMVPAFETAAFALATGTISDVVETEFGFHLIEKLDARPEIDKRLRVIKFPKATDEDFVPAPSPWKTTQLTGRQLQSARVDFDPNTGSAQVSLQFDAEGGELFAELTKRNVSKPIAIFLDGQSISEPVVQQEIIGGQAVISGNFTIEEAKILARRLQAGALPVPIELIAQQSVGPTLGADSLQKSLFAGLVGFALVALYMVLLYRLPGLVSVLALGLYAAMSAALFKLIPVTLTLSGIAGFILSIGIAVDANVLIFERLKEELKGGKTILPALEDAFRRAWPSIRDGHVTVLISCAVLFWFSSSVIKGFSLTLALGMILSLFTAVVSTRTLLRVLMRTRLAEQGWLYLKPKA